MKKITFFSHEIARSLRELPVINSQSYNHYKLAPQYGLFLINHVHIKLFTPIKTGNSRFDSNLTPEPRPIQQRNFSPRGVGNMKGGRGL